MEFYPVGIQQSDALGKERTTNDGPSSGDSHSPIEDKPQ